MNPFTHVLLVWRSATKSSSFLALNIVEFGVSRAAPIEALSNGACFPEKLKIGGLGHSYVPFTIFCFLWTGRKISLYF